MAGGGRHMSREGRSGGALTSFFASFCCAIFCFAFIQSLLGPAPPSDGAEAVPCPLAEVLVEGGPPCFEGSFPAHRPPAPLECERVSVAGGRWLSGPVMLGKLDMVERVSLGRDSHEMLPLSPRIIPRAALPRAPLYEA